MGSQRISMCHKDGERDAVTVRWSLVKEAWRAQQGMGYSRSDKDVAEVCEGWWLRERGEAGDSEIVKIPEYLSLELTPHLEGEGQSWEGV